MNEGRSQAGEASSVLGISGYVFGAIVSPLVGIGDVFHSTVVVFVSLTILVIICSFGSKAIAPDLNK